MIRSLRRVEADCIVTVLCLTPECRQILTAVNEPGVVLCDLSDLEKKNPDVAAVKDGRSTYEYYCTLTGCLASSVLDDAGPDDIVTYLDADLLFYSDPAPIFRQLENASVGIIGHRYHWWTKRLAKFGLYNVGWVSFRNDAVGREAARWWRDRCVEWCYLRLEDGRYADQKYLEQMFTRFPSVVEITHPGTNVAPWNLGRHAISYGLRDEFLVDDKHRLIFFHFAGFREIAPGAFLTNHVAFLAPFSRVVRRGLYEPYVRALKDIRREIGAHTYDSLPIVVGGSKVKRAMFKLRSTILQLTARIAGHYIT